MKASMKTCSIDLNYWVNVADRSAWRGQKSIGIVKMERTRHDKATRTLVMRKAKTLLSLPDE